MELNDKQDTLNINALNIQLLIKVFEVASRWLELGVDISKSNAKDLDLAELGAEKCAAYIEEEREALLASSVILELTTLLKDEVQA